MENQIVNITFDDETDEVYTTLVKTSKTEQELKDLMKPIIKRDDWTYEDLLNELEEKGHIEQIACEEYQYNF